MNQRRWGAVLSYVNIILTVFVGLLYTPLMLRLLGQSEFGLYSLIGSVVGYLSVLDMGLGNTLVRYTAKNRVDGTAQREAEINGLFLFFYSIIGIITLIAGAVLYANMDSLFCSTLNDGEMQRARIMTVLLIFNFAFSFPFSIFASIMQAYEKFIFLRVSNILRVVLNPLLTLPFLYWGYGSVMMVVVSTLLNFACLFANWFYCVRYLQVKFRRGHFEWSFLQEVAVYSFWIFLNAVMDKIYWGTGQFVLGIVAGTLQVAIYAIAMQFMMMYMNFSTAISGVMLPKVTMMVANGANASELTKLMIRVGRLQYYVVGYFFVMFLLVGDMFIKLWAGEEYLAAYTIVLLLMGALLIPLVQNVGITILQAMNLNRYRTMSYTVCAFLALAVSFPLAKYYNGWGCAVATAGALIISTGVIMNRYYACKIRLQVGLFWKSILSQSRGMVLVAFIGWSIRAYWNPADSWNSMLMLILLYTFIYCGLMYGWCMNRDEQTLCRRIILKVRGKV